MPGGAMARHPVVNSLSLPRPSRLKGTTMKRTSLSILAILLAGSTSIAAAAEPSRIRGTISSVSPDKIVVHTTAGADLPIGLNAGTAYLQVVKSSLDKVEKDSYIGTATKTIGSNQIALEVVVFPPAMKGVGDGHYDWDKIPDTTLSGGKSYSSSSMTNGSVTAVTTPSTATVKSAMTNGNVSAASNQNGVKTLTVTYKGGQQTILVPPTAPIVTFLPGTTADLAKGASVFIQATTNGDATTAALVAVGKDGVKPPM
jgi:hypothetical protein